MTQATPACARPTTKFPDGRTGTSAGYAAHRAHSEAPCGPCVTAWTAKSVEYIKNLSPEAMERRAQNRNSARRQTRAERVPACVAASPDRPDGLRGTVAGYEAHTAAGQRPCAECRRAPVEAGAVCAIRTLTHPQGRTGTAAGYQAHRGIGETPCDECRTAFSAQSIARRRSLSPEELERHRTGNAAATRRRRAADPEGTRATKHRTIARNRGALQQAKDKPCADCGIRYPYYVMEFDHLDSETKEFNVSAGVTRVSYERLLAEIAKCDVVCANCHRFRTAKRAEERALRA